MGIDPRSTICDTWFVAALNSARVLRVLIVELLVVPQRHAAAEVPVTHRRTINKFNDVFIIIEWFVESVLVPPRDVLVVKLCNGVLPCQIFLERVSLGGAAQN